ncbi:hypothetical protein O7635_09855 [Asanoa sp. WMMD1127]|uniref:hypothetical protein n=1 Tax=Asanoa sp. WMMD1127 TaxID=3016107 RepID=UPI002415C7B5|nr:hypothetical protein [Asanoa sp. WMMD1127]MDG4822157.1 hypothetical protein [Asanoa sp. WMMD1127]
MSEPVSVDFDLLADYVGGALDGTPEGERVATLVAADPDWGREHAVLVAALEATAGELAVYAEQTAEPMPDEVFARLLSALQAAHEPAAQAAHEPAAQAAHEPAAQAAHEPAAETAHESAAAVPSAGVDGEAADSALRTTSLDISDELSAGQDAGLSAAEEAAGERRSDDADRAAARGQRTGPARDRRGPGGRRPQDGGRPGSGRRRSRWLGWAAPILAAVAVAGFAGVWINQSVDSGSTNENSAVAGAADAPQAQENALTVPRFASGRDYSGAAVAQGFVAPLPSGRAFSSAGPMAATDAANERDNQAAGAEKAVDPELLRLSTGAALAVCVEAITRAHGQGPLTVDAADFASYQGRPAVLVFFSDPSGARWGWAVGPDCGASGPDDLFRSRVG